MKTRLLTLLFTLLTCGLFAQEGFHISIMGMPQNTWIINQEDTETSRTNFQYKSTWGYSGMLKIGYNIGDPLGFHLGILYSLQGQKHTSIDSLGVSILTHRELSYIKVPLLLHINSDPAPVMFNLEIGPQIGFLRDATLSEDGIPLNLPFDAKYLYKPSDIAFTWAIGAQFNFTEWFAFILQHRGDYGLFDMEDKQFTFGNRLFYPNGRDKSNNAVFGLMAGFNFSFLPSGSGRRTKFWFR